MRRRTLDALLTTGGLIVAAVLLVAGGLIDLGQQLRGRRGPHPARGAAHLPSPPRPARAAQRPAGQALPRAVRGAAADHGCAGQGLRRPLHQGPPRRVDRWQDVLRAERRLPGQPGRREGSGLVDLAFRGETLRGLLLNAYAFGTMGTIAMYAAWASFIGARRCSSSALLGFRHLRRVPVEEEVGAACATRPRRARPSPSRPRRTRAPASPAAGALPCPLPVATGQNAV